MSYVHIIYIDQIHFPVPPLQYLACFPYQFPFPDPYTVLK